MKYELQLILVTSNYSLQIHVHVLSVGVGEQVAESPSPRLSLPWPSQNRHVCVQWNQSNTDTNGEEVSFFSEVSSFQRLKE